VTVGDRHFPARAEVVIRAKEQTGQRIRINVAFEAHPGTALNVEDGTVAFVTRRGHWAAGNILR